MADVSRFDKVNRSEERYSIGIDFGTASARALLVRLADGAEVATAVMTYPDGVIDERLPGNGVALGLDWALQNPTDYLTTLEHIVREVRRESDVAPEQVVGLGIDFTSCTVLPVTNDGTPLCALPQFQHEPHAWVKLWRHHAAQPQADRMNGVARERSEEFLQWYGGKILSEWLYPKLLQIAEEAPRVADATARFLEGGDWVVWQLTGTETRNSCAASYKAQWEKGRGLPDDVYFEAVRPGFARTVARVLPQDRIIPLGSRAGGLTADWAARLGLRPGLAVAAGNVDSFVSAPAAAITGPNRMLMIMGTSICHVMMGTRRVPVPGMTGVAKDGILPGFFGYEAGQASVGDIFGWFVRTCVPASYQTEARERGMSVHDVLRERASPLLPGESGLVALDWWTGNRSILADANLTGLIAGLTVATRPEEIYRALIEATAFGTRVIIEAFNGAGVRVDELYACGGLPERNSMLVQIYADVTGMPIRMARSAQTPALGAAMFGAVAAGGVAGGYDTIEDAAAHMGGLRAQVFTPQPSAVETYNLLYRYYRTLHDYFGRGDAIFMHGLKALQERVRNAAPLALPNAHP